MSQRLGGELVFMEGYSDMDFVLTAENLDFGYSGANPLLRSFSIALSKGGMVGLIGPNGAGKSTVLKLLSGYLKPSSGIVRLMGEDVSTMPDKNRSRLLAVVGQNVLSPLPFTARQVVEMGRAARVPRFSPFSEADAAAVESAMSEMDVVRFADRMFNALSGGEKQRVKLAAALAQDPDVLLLDEPTSQLDMGHSARLMRHLLKINSGRGVSIMVVSHDIQLVAGFMREIVFIRDGSLVASGKPDEVLTPSIIGECYDCDVEVYNSPSGGTAVSPIV
jgi:iron complex transport system ATP-binding protein